MSCNCNLHGGIWSALQVFCRVIHSSCFSPFVLLAMFAARCIFSVLEASPSLASRLSCFLLWNEPFFKRMWFTNKESLFTPIRMEFKLLKSNSEELWSEVTWQLQSIAMHAKRQEREQIKGFASHLRGRQRSRERDYCTLIPSDQPINTSEPNIGCSEIDNVTSLFWTFLMSCLSARSER